MQCFITELGGIRVEHVHRYHLRAKVRKLSRQLDIHALVTTVIRSGDQNKELLPGREAGEDFPALLLQCLLKANLGVKSFLHCILHLCCGCTQLATKLAQ